MDHHAKSDMMRRGFYRTARRWTILLLFALLAFGCLLIVCKHRSHRIAQAVTLLRENEVHFTVARQDEMQWCHRLGIFDSPPTIRSVSLHSQQNLEAIVPALVQLGTVAEIEYYNLTERELRLISKVRSIEVIRAQWGGRAEEVRPFLSHRIKDYSVSGADHNIPRESLELLFSIPTLERIGTAHGEASIPYDLRLQRPDIAIYLTDYPP
jgi:hypothetical protein